MEHCYKNKWILLFLMIPFFKPICFQYFSILKILEGLFLVWKVVSAAIIGLLLLNHLNRRKKIPEFIILVSVFEMSILLSTICRQGYLLRAIIDIVSIVTFVTILIWGIQFNYKDTIWGLSRILSVLVLINMLSMMIFPHGMPADLYANNALNPLYFMTIDNGSTLFLLFAMLIFSIELYTIEGIVEKYQFVLIFCCLASAFLSHSGTASLIIMVETGLLILIYKNKVFENVQWKMLSLIYGLGAVGMILVPESALIKMIMTNIFHYSSDLSGRSLLWSEAIKKIGKHVLLGYGRQVQDYISAWGGYFSSHNFWLELLLQGGLVALFLLFCVIVFSFRQLENGKQTRQIKSILVTFFLIMVSVMMESAVHSVFIFGTMVLICYNQNIPGVGNNQKKQSVRNRKKTADRPTNVRNIPGMADMPEFILLSTIVPVYNGEKYLDNLVESIASQQFPYMELILVDDGSSDHTLKICKKMASRYLWIRVIHTKNMGVSHARNTGLEVARGQWIHFMDADDEIDPGMYTEFVRNVARGHQDIVICGCHRVMDGKKTACGPNMTEILDREGMKKLFDHMEMNTRYWLLDYIWNKWYRRDIIEKNKLRFCETMNLGEDFLFNAGYFRYVSELSLISDCFYQYLIHESGLVSKFQEKPWEGREKLYHAQIELYQSLGILFDNQNWIQQQAGQIAFGDIRTINSPRCCYNRKQKKEFVEKMLNSPQYEKILNYLKIKGKSSVVFRIYYYLFLKHHIGCITCMIGMEKFICSYKHK